MGGGGPRGLGGLVPGARRWPPQAARAAGVCRCPWCLVRARRGPVTWGGALSCVMGRKPRTASDLSEPGNRSLHSFMRAWIKQRSIAPLL